MKGTKINYSQDELLFVQSHCTLPMLELHKSFCETFIRDDVSAVNLNALRKRNGWKTGRTGCFEKGNVPFNKGVKGINYEGMQATQFGKGHKPANHKPVGTTRITEVGYKEIKTAEGMHKWRLFHRVVWERLNGKIPRGMVLIFKDGDKQNPSITNLELVTRVQNMERNSLHRFPKEVTHLIQLQGAINRQINKRVKQNEQHRHA